MPAPPKTKMDRSSERGEMLMSAMDIVFLIVVAGGFLSFAAGVGGLQWWLNR
jgi:hypothetical protein